MGKTRILVVEDEFIVAEDIKVHLTNFGYEVIGTVNTGESAIENARDMKPDMILMDITLQGELSGIEAADQIRINYSIPVIYLTAFAQKETIELAKKTGPYGFLTKPINYDDLQRTIDIALYKHEMEGKFKASEERFKKISSSAYDGIILINNKGKITFWNNSAEKIFGYSAKEILNNDLHDLIAPAKYHEAIKKGFANFIKTGSGKAIGKVLEIEGIKKDGSLINIELSLSAFKEKTEWNAVGIVRDITERKLAEQEQRRLTTALEQADESVVITDTQGNIQHVNPAFEKITGYKKSEVLGKNPRILKSEKHSDEFYKNLWDTISKGKVWKGRFINKKKDGSLHDEDATISPVSNREGEIINYVALKRDITNEMKLEHQLRQSQKMQTIGTLAGGIAHDFNNILAPLFGYTEMLLQDLPQGSHGHEDLKQVLKAATRAKDLVNQILTFSRQGESERQPLMIHLIINETIQLLKATLPATINISSNIKKNIGMVLADPTQIHQVVMNLCTNASHAMREKGGTMEVKLDSVDLDALNANQFENLSKGNYARISISDSGQGMEKHVVERIFEPFFTTKPVGEGTGLGLSVTHGIVKSHCGEIIVESEPGVGSIFQVFLPITSNGVHKKSNNLEKPPHGNKEHILVVDDDDNLVEMLNTMLNRLNYKVTPITNSRRALKLFREAPKSFDVVISDQTMPGMSGVQLSKEILNIRPNMPILLSTGYSETINRTKAKQLGIKGFITKPFYNNEIAVLIRDILNKNG